MTSVDKCMGNQLRIPFALVWVSILVAACAGEAVVRNDVMPSATTSLEFPYPARSATSRALLVET